MGWASPLGAPVHLHVTRLSVRLFSFTEPTPLARAHGYRGHEDRSLQPTLLCQPVARGRQRCLSSPQRSKRCEQGPEESAVTWSPPAPHPGPRVLSQTGAAGTRACPFGARSLPPQRAGVRICHRGWPSKASPGGRPGPGPKHLPTMGDVQVLRSLRTLRK